MFHPGEVRVSVPATSANLGPGFDALGLALDLRDVVTASVADSLSIRVEGADAVPLDETHLVYRSMVRAFEALGVEAPGVLLHCANRIPHGRGLGSSSAAIVAGVASARALVAGGDLLMDDNALFSLAADIEGHPDNVAPAVYGGFTIAYAEGGRFRATSLAVDPRVEVVVLVPSTPVETKVARGLLPATVSHADAAANAGRAALLVAALTARPELLYDATRDWLHQDYREPAMPETLALVRALRDKGYAAIVSGAGPTVLAFCDASTADGIAEQAPIGWQALRPRIDRDGVRLS
ncbi:MAG TPA: homoserine kinase [Nocardioidaceae bacterium]|nr:homoserine kinase [Nocardioidaceae bacterium]